MRHDYNLPRDYEARIQNNTLSEWYTQQRVLRQALRQDTSWAAHAKHGLERAGRRERASSGSVDVEE